MSGTIPIEVNPAMVALCLSAAALFIAWLTFNRAGDWRQSDAGKETNTKITGLGDRLTKLETRFENLATKSDFERLQGQISTIKAELDGVRGDAAAAAAGVARIEAFLMDASQQ